MCKHVFLHRYNVINKYEEFICIKCGFRIVYNGRTPKNYDSP
jgi:DNA-directed RNA polymerase subunit RPC12/RpoP